MSSEGPHPRSLRSNPERGAPPSRGRVLKVFLCALFLPAFSVWGALPQKAGNHPIERPVIFVATNGNDHWSGRLASPNPGKNDGPFASLLRALQASREATKNGGPSALKPSICLRGGLYILKETVVLASEDSGLQISAFEREKPVLSGGVRVTGWRPLTLNSRPLWAAQLPEISGLSNRFHEMWVNGVRAVRARHPNKGYFAVAEVPDKSAEWTKGNDRFRFRENDLPAWDTITNAEIIVMNRWVESRLPIKNVNQEARLVEFTKRSVFDLAAGDLYYLENALEALDEPGEWFLDGQTRTVYYLPRRGEQMDRSEAIAPSLAQVLRLEGKPEAGRLIENVSFTGLTFAHTEWCFPESSDSKSGVQVYPAPSPEVGGFAQAAIGVPAAVGGQGLRHCSFQNCAFSNLGNYGLELGRGCQSNRIFACEFVDLGAGGCKIGETRIRESAAEQTRANQVINCRVHDGGKLFPSGIGIWLGQSSDNVISHNAIYDFFYTGISIGWTWGYGSAAAGNNLVEQNHVHHIGVKSDGDGPILSDMGGIYTLGKQPGTRIINNLWHDIAGFRYGGWGIYLDEGSSGILVQSNVVYRTTHGGFHQHYGETNILRNNIFAFARDHQVQRSRVEPHLSFSFETNILYFDKGVLLGGEWSGDQYQMDWNIIYDARSGSRADSLRFGKATLEEWRARGHDRNSVFADPLFVAPSKDDFRLLRIASPALKMGFQPIDTSLVGPLKILR